jgi:hypothetical protein
MSGRNQCLLPRLPQGVFAVTAEYEVRNSTNAQHSADTLHEILQIGFEVEHFVTDSKIDCSGRDPIPLRCIE